MKYLHKHDKTKEFLASLFQVNIMAPPQINRLRVSDFLTFEIRQERNTKLLVYRNGIDNAPHLTISFGNASGEIDIHLTTRIKDKVAPDYQPIAKIPAEELGKALASIEPIMKKSLIENIHKIKKIRPGWLGRKGYAVIYLDDNAEREFIDTVAPKNRRKGKWERFLDSPALNEYINSSEVRSNIFHPSILHKLATLECKEPVFAFRIYGRHKPKLLPVGLFKMPNGKKYWIRLDKITENIKDSVESYIFSCFQKLLPEDAWTIIQSKMQLEELAVE